MSLILRKGHESYLLAGKESSIILIKLFMDNVVFIHMPSTHRGFGDECIIHQHIPTQEHHHYYGDELAPPHPDETAEKTHRAHQFNPPVKII